MMQIRLFLSLFLSISPLTLVLADIHLADAQTPPLCCKDNDRPCRKTWPRVPLCSRRIGVYTSNGSHGSGHIPPELLAQSRNRIAQGNATVDDYLLDAYANAVEENFTAAQTRYSQALELAVKNKDIEGQAIAQSSMGEIYAATGNLKEAVSQLTLARGIYKGLGNVQRASELNQRLVEINNLLRVNPSRL